MVRPNTTKTVKVRDVPVLETEPPDGEIGTIAINTVLNRLHGDEAFAVSEVSLDRLVRMVHSDGQAAGILNLIKLPIVASDWEIREFDGKSQTEAALVEQNFRQPPNMGGMTTPMSYIMADMAMASVTGFRGYEKVFWKPTPSLVLYRKIAPRNPLTLSIKQDQYGGFDGFVQRVPSDAYASERIIPKNKALLFTRNKEDNPLYGRSDFLAAYYHYDKLHKLYYIAHLAFQLEAVPMRIGYYPTNADKTDKEAFFQALKNLGTDAAMRVPQGFDVKEFGTQKPGHRFTELINHHAEQMAVSMLASFLNSGDRASYAKSKNESSIFMLALEAFTREIDEHINFYVIPQLIDYNFLSRKYPKFVHKPLVDEKREIISTTFQKLMASPNEHATPEFMLSLEEQMARDLGMNIDYEAIRDERLAQMVRDKEKQAQVQAGAVTQLAETFTITDDGHVQPTEKTYALLETLNKEAEEATTFKLAAMGINLEDSLKRALEAHAAKTAPVPQVIVNESAGVDLTPLGEGMAKVAAATSEGMAAVAVAMASRPADSVNVTIPEGAVKVDVPPTNVTIAEGAVQMHMHETKEEKAPEEDSEVTLKRDDEGNLTVKRKRIKRSD